MLIRRRPTWYIPESRATPESAYLDRRNFLKGAGAVAAGLTLGSAGCADQATRAQPAPANADPRFRTSLPSTPTAGLYPAHRNAAFTLDRELTDELVAATYNNFYEFTTTKEQVWRLAESLSIRPWTVDIAGLVKQPKRWDIDQLIRKLPLEERLYRHRCVEAWAMAVPWTGFPLRSLVDLVQPNSNAKFIRFFSLADKKTMPGLSAGYPWPYNEALTMDEAANDMALIATGIYGHQLPKQHGAPIRLVLPWKYGFKSIKSIVRIEFTDKRPPTFWNTASPQEYGFYANVNPQVPHPRWSQASERLIGTGARRPTLLYNGYADRVADLYKDLKIKHFF